MNELLRLFQTVKADFSSLWTCRERGNSLEIISPYSLLDGESISVFVTRRGSRIIVSDGAHLSAIEDEQGICLSQRKGAHYTEMLDKFGIKEVMSKNDDQAFRYKSTLAIESFTSAVYDMIHFSEVMGNTIYINTLFDEDDDDAVKRFSTKVKESLRVKIRDAARSGDRFEMFSHPESRLWQFNAGVRKVGTQEIWLGMSIARSNLPTFRSSVQRAEFGFNHILKTRLAQESRLHLGAVVDELPSPLQMNPGVRSLETAMGEWDAKLGAKRYSFNRFENSVELKNLVAA